MSAVKAMKSVQASGHPDKQRKTGRNMDWYPVLGLALAIFMAVLTYGGIYFHLFDD
jgi:hypothetical protein